MFALNLENFANYLRTQKCAISANKICRPNILINIYIYFDTWIYHSSLLLLYFKLFLIYAQPNYFKFDTAKKLLKCKLYPLIDLLFDKITAFNSHLRCHKNVLELLISHNIKLA